MKEKVTVQLEVAPATLASVEDFVASTQQGELFATHGSLSFESLLELLIEDVALMQDHPGSREGEAMFRLLVAHGYIS